MRSGKSGDTGVLEQQRWTIFPKHVGFVKFILVKLTPACNYRDWEMAKKIDANEIRTRALSEQRGRTIDPEAATLTTRSSHRFQAKAEGLASGSILILQRE